MEKVTMIDRIKNLMHDKNISQVELAKLCKTTQSSLSPALSGKRKIGEKFGRNIASALGVSYNWLLYGEGKRWRTMNMYVYPICRFLVHIIFVSRTCKSALLNQSVMHNRGVSAPFATNRYGSPLLFRSLYLFAKLPQAFQRPC